MSIGKDHSSKITKIFLAGSYWTDGKEENYYRKPETNTY